MRIFVAKTRQGLTYAPRALAVWSALPLVVLGAAGLTVDSLSPDALCPPLEETRSAVAARLGSVELDGTWHASYVVVHRSQGDFVTLSLRDPEGALRLERDLPVQGGSCATLSRVIALVLERFFMRPEQAVPADAPAPAVKATLATPASPSEPLPEPARPPSPSPKAISAPPPLDAAVTREPRAAPPYRLSAAFWATTSWKGPSLGLARTLSGPYRLALNAAFDLDQHEAKAFEGTASLRRFPLALDCERELDVSPTIQARAALELLGVVEDARTTALAESGSGLRLVPGLGARVGARFFTDSPAQPFADLTFAWLLRQASPAFQVGGQELLRPPALVFGLALGISTPF